MVKMSTDNQGNPLDENGKHHKFTPQESRNILAAASLSTLPYGLAFADEGSENSETSKWKIL